MRDRRTIRFALAFVLGAKLALLAQGEVPALASGPARGGAKPAARRRSRRAPPTPVAAHRRGAQARGPRRCSRRWNAARPSSTRASTSSRARRSASPLYEKDVTAKVASLEEIEKRLSARAKAATQAVDAAAESLAKIYGAMKPEAAAPILDRLDDPTVLTIFRRMKEKQVGEILPLMTRERAIALTQALADRN